MDYICKGSMYTWLPSVDFRTHEHPCDKRQTPKLHINDQNLIIGSIGKKSRVPSAGASLSAPTGFLWCYTWCNTRFNHIKPANWIQNTRFRCKLYRLDRWIYPRVDFIVAMLSFLPRVPHLLNDWTSCLHVPVINVFLHTFPLNPSCNLYHNTLK